MPQYIQMFELFQQQVSVSECIGFVFGIAGVWLTIRQNILCFPIGIINVGIYSFIFFNSKLYSNAVLQLVYIALLIYGWIHWKSKTASDEFPVTNTNRSLGFVLLIFGVTASILLGYLMKKTTDAPLPYWDATTTSMSLIAQWMVARKKIENWLLWIVADVIYVGMYVHQSLYLTAVLYFVFLILALKGYLEWKKDMSKKPLSASH